MSPLSFLHRRRPAPKPAGHRTYIASNGYPVTVVPKTAVPLTADLGDGLDLSAAEDRQRWAEASPAASGAPVPLSAPAGPPWEGASATGQMEPPTADPGWPSYLHDTLTDIPPAHYRPYVPEPEPVYVADLEDDIGELTIFRATVRAELIRRNRAQGHRDSRPWQERYAIAYDDLWLDCDRLIEPDYVFADELRAAHADALDVVRTDMESRMARMAGLEPVAA
jgi:hypothetical protein